MSNTLNLSTATQSQIIDSMAKEQILNGALNESDFDIYIEYLDTLDLFSFEIESAIKGRPFSVDTESAVFLNR